MVRDTVIQSVLENYKKNFAIVDVIDLDQWYEQDFALREVWLRQKLQLTYKASYTADERIIFVLLQGDEYHQVDDATGIIMMTLQRLLNEIDISNFFCVVITDEITGSVESRTWLQENISIDTIPICFETIPMHTDKKITDQKLSPVYSYDSVQPVKVGLESLNDRQRYLLAESSTFCMYPWIHLHAYPTGEAYPCCHAEQKNGSLGNTRQQSLQEIWNSEKLKKIRISMLNEKPHGDCVRCYEQEAAGFFSGRRSANKHHGHHIGRVSETQADGSLDRFEMIYWDIRFSNLCNLRCRSCGHIFSSQWYQDQAKLAGPEWKARNQVLNYAGRTELDMWEQLQPHLDYVEQIYFAGGEPLLMEEHYRILEELERRKRFDVRLIYNTNFTEIRLKDRLVFDYWKKFHSVAVGASLDAMGPRGEYIRKGTDWAQIEQNRRHMMHICPDVDFYISPTLSIMNAWHLPDFHRNWVDQGLIRAQDLNVNILQDPDHYRIDIAPMKYKQRLRIKFEEHLAWLRPLDRLNRATVGFESAITFMMSTDNTELIPNFWDKTHRLDEIRRERLLDVIPELEALL